MSAHEQLQIGGGAVAHPPPGHDQQIVGAIRYPPSGFMTSTEFISTLRRALRDAGIGPGDEFVVGRARSLSSDGQARRGDPATARAAAKDSPPKRGSQRAKILAALAAGDPERIGLTSSALAEATGIPYRSVTPRIGELKRWGYVVPTGATRMGDMGSKQEVVALTPKGAAAAAGLV